MSEHALTAQETLIFLDDLRQFLESAASRERLLETGFRTGKYRAHSDRETALAALDDELRAALENEELTYQMARRSLELRRERRQRRIQAAYRAQSQRTQDRISQARDQVTYDLQKGELHYQRGMDELRARYAGWRDYLSRTAGRLSKMRSAALHMVGSTGGFRGLLGQRATAGEAAPATVGDGIEAMHRHLQASHELLLDFRARRTGVPLSPEEAKTKARELAEHLGSARSLLATLVSRIDSEETGSVAALEAENRAYMAAVDQNYQEHLRQTEEMRLRQPQAIAGQFQRLQEREERASARAFSEMDAHHAAKMELLREVHQKRTTLLQQSQWEAVEEAGKRYEEDWAALESEWRRVLTGKYRALEQLQAEATRLFPAWSLAQIESWVPPVRFEHCLRLGEIQVRLRELVSRLPTDERLALPGPHRFAMPLLLSIPRQASLLLETADAASRAQALPVLNQAMLRLLALVPPGRAAFTILDPVGLGESFSGFMHLADYEESLIHSKIWTQPEQIERRLTELGEHMEKVIQMYLRNEFASITDYNEQAGTIAERYRFLVVADFPNGFGEQAIQKLMSIATSGARCGVHLLLHWDRRLPCPPGLKEEDLRRACASINCRDGAFTLAGQPAGTELLLDAGPEPGLAKEFIHRVGRASIDSSHVEVPFELAAPPPEALWSRRTMDELRVPIGRTGATKLQELALGKATRQHVLVAGKTGSGKSTLFHVIITNLSLWSSPDEVEFYLIDFKKGVEFKCYATHRLPHARVVAIESDREFGLSVLQRVDEELRRRGDLFRKLGVQDLPGYFKAGGKEALPRCLLLVDEFQEFFVEDDRIAQTAALLLDRVVRQGRAFGIHAILGSQTLGGAFTVGRATLGQIVVRVALQCNEADSYLILDENNAAARLLSRPGEGIYNDLGGAPEGNRPFQVVWLSDEQRDASLARVRDLANLQGRAHSGPIVFEGNAPAELAENIPLRQMLASPPAARPLLLKAFLGAPNSIKGPTAAEFQRLSGSHLLLIGQRDESALSLLFSSLVSLAAQAPAAQLRFVVADGSPPDSLERTLLDQFASRFPGSLQRVRHQDLEPAFAQLQEELARRSESPQLGASEPSIFLCVLGLHRFKKLKADDEFAFSLQPGPAATPPAILQNLLQDGPGLGMHVWLSCDAFSNVQRFLGRKLLGEFDLRVAFQMSASDSASFIDSPKAGDLGLNRALLSNEQQGFLETFRPYALPDDAWLDEAFSLLARPGAAQPSPSA